MTPPAVTPAATKTSRRESANTWSPQQSAELYGIESWGHGFFGVNRKGHVTVKLEDDQACKEVSLHDIIEGLHDRGTRVPVLLRFRDLLH